MNLKSAIFTVFYLPLLAFGQSTINFEDFPSPIVGDVKIKTEIRSRLRRICEIHFSTMTTTSCFQELIPSMLNSWVAAKEESEKAIRKGGGLIYEVHRKEWDESDRIGESMCNRQYGDKSTTCKLDLSNVIGAIIHSYNSYVDESVNRPAVQFGTLRNRPSVQRSGVSSFMHCGGVVTSRGNEYVLRNDCDQPMGFYLSYSCGSDIESQRNQIRYPESFAVAAKSCGTVRLNTPCTSAKPLSYTITNILPDARIGLKESCPSTTSGGGSPPRTEPASASGCVGLSQIVGDDFIYTNKCNRAVNIKLRMSCFNVARNDSRDAALRVPQNGESKTKLSYLFGSFCPILAGNSNTINIIEQVFGN